MDMMNQIYHKYIDLFIIVFIDDILVYSQSEVEHELYLHVVLETLGKHQLYAKHKNYKL